jgi:hypothetical protein
VPDNLQSASLAWALTHVRRFGDTDIFPIPFEYDAIAHDWNSVGPYLEQLDLGSYKTRPDRRTMVLKPGGGFRAATQLDPLDHLIYTAAVFEAAERVEAARIPADQRIACSYRVRTTPEGAFFAPESGWKDFYAHSREMAESGRFTHFLTADIADFYNRLGQHRIQNALELAGVSVERSKNLERFLNVLTGKQSQGLPVGPFGSIILAEASLIDVDSLLMRERFDFARYVDDFHVFCTSRKDAIQKRHRLSAYLFSAHRLSLEGGKTAVAFVEKFLKDELSDPEELEQRVRVERIKEIFDKIVAENGPYWFEGLDESEEAKLLTKAEREGFAALFSECVNKHPLRLGLVRYLLRKGFQSRMTGLIEIIFQNLETLAPALRDTVRYLAKTIPRARALTRGRDLLRFCKESAVGELPYVRLWILELLFRRPDLCSASDAISLATESAPDLGYRPASLLASVYGQIDWVRDRKETWRNYEPWDRRALIWSASVLPTGEKRPFLNMVAEQGDILEAAVAKFLLSK